MLPDILAAIRETVEAVIEKHWPSIEARIDARIAEYMALRLSAPKEEKSGND